MKTQYFFATILVVFLLFKFPLKSEDTLATKNIPDTVRQFGVFGAYNLNYHIPDFRKLPGIPNCCLGFKDGEGKGYSAGAFLEMPLPFRLFAGLRASITKLDGWLKEKETTMVRVQDSVIVGVFEHNLKANILTFGFEPYLRFNPIYSLGIFAGGRIAFPIQKKFDQWEQLVEPADRGVFVDTQSRIRNKFSGDIPKAKSIQTDIQFGISYDFALNKHKSLILSPFVSYHFGMNDVADSVKWKINSFRIGLSIKYLPIHIEKPKAIEPREEFRKEYIIDTIVVESENVHRSRFSYGKERKDTSIQKTAELITIVEKIYRTDTLFRKPKPIAKIDVNTTTIYLETQFVTQAFPILPIVFFEYNSSEILNFYTKIQRADEFNYDSLPTKPLELNKQILNIIGYRLKQKSESQITIVGFSDSTTEKASCELARKRAEAVKNYLVNVWKIEPKRILIQTGKERCYPKNRTITPNDSGYSENRRVLITSSDPEILQPVAKKRFLELLDFKPRVLEFNPKNSFLHGLRRWYLNVEAEGKTILSYSGNENPSTINENIQDKLADLLTHNQTLIVNFTVEDNEGNISQDIKRIAVVNDTNEIEIQRLSLILFDVASAEIPRGTKSEIAKFLATNSELTQARIIGYSDILGDRDFNYELSKKRAEKTLELIKNIDPNIEILEVKGVGSSAFPPGNKSYSSPAERFLSRTVYIELIKKWK